MQPGRDHVERIAQRELLLRMFGSTAGSPEIGRYTLLEPLGQGGHGIVYRARDPELGRDVALKVLRSSDTGPDRARRTARLLREARALARLSHPHLVPVYDVGTYADVSGWGVFIVMELAQGVSLQRWLAAARPWREIVRVLMDAGRGLAAAHREGIVHRDFKPQNVQVADRVLVLDFGLAGEAGGETSSGKSDGHATGGLTETGDVLGTPAYMAPEQHDGQRADARSDQFAFCVTLYEALAGERPFGAATFATLASEKRSGEIAPHPRPSGVPARVWAAIRRGLAPDPTARWPSMGALLEELEAATRRRGPLLGVAGLVAGLAVWGWFGGSTAPPCETSLSDQTQRERVDRVLATSTGPDASRLSSTLQQYADAWSLAATEACSEDRRARRGCLEERAAEFHATMDAILDDPDRTGASALALAEALTPVERCREAGDAVAGPPEVVNRIRTELAAIDPLIRASACARAAERAHEVAETARAEAPALVGDAEHRRGRALRCLGRAEGGSHRPIRGVLRRGAGGAIRAGHRDRGRPRRGIRDAR